MYTSFVLVRQARCSSGAPAHHKDFSVLPITFTPMLLAVPTIVLQTDSSGTSFMSCCFTLAISYTCLAEIVAADWWPGRWLPLSMPAACLMKYVVGGVFVTCRASPYATLVRALQLVIALHALIPLHDCHSRCGSAAPCSWIVRFCNDGRDRPGKAKRSYISVGLVTVCSNDHRDRCISLNEHTSTFSCPLTRLTQPVQLLQAIWRNHGAYFDVSCLGVEIFAEAHDV